LAVPPFDEKDSLWAKKSKKTAKKGISGGLEVIHA
jgi:hypothetical protein